MTTTMTDELAAAIADAGPEITADVANIFRHTGTTGSPAAAARGLLADILDTAVAGRAEIGAPDRTLVGWVATVTESDGAQKVVALIQDAESAREAGPDWGSPVTRLRAAAWREVDAARFAGLLDQA